MNYYCSQCSRRHRFTERPGTDRAYCPNCKKITGIDRTSPAGAAAVLLFLAGVAVLIIVRVL